MVNRPSGDDDDEESDDDDDDDDDANEGMAEAGVDGVDDEDGTVGSEVSIEFGSEAPSDTSVATSGSSRSDEEDDGDDKLLVRTN